MADLGLLEGIASGLQQGLSSYMTTKNMLEDRRLKAEQAAREEKNQQQQAMAQQEKMDFEKKKFSDEFEYKKQYNSQKLQQEKLLKELELKSKGRSSGTKELAEMQIPGLLKAPGVNPSKQDVEKVKEAKIARDDMLMSIQNLKKLNAQAQGAELMPGPLKDQIQKERRNIILKQKNLESLGQLSASDIGLAESVIASDPTSLSAKNILGALTGGKYGTSEQEVAGSLSAAEGSIQDRFGSMIKTRGFEEPVQKTASEDKVAVEWALSNPKDPRAAAILRANGMQVGGK